MVTRIWHGKTKKENEIQYLKFLLEAGTDEYRQTFGNRSIKVWKNHEEDACHFWTVTEWNDLDSVKDFAGEDFEKAKYYPQDDGMLLEFEERVAHYESFDVSNSKIKSYIAKLEQTYHGGNWLAESFDGKLKDITEAEAFEAPIQGVHSVAEVVWHCIYWRMVLIERLRGNNNYRDETVNELNFLLLDELRKRGWNTLQRELQETQSSLLEFLQDKTDDFLEREYQPGCTYEYVLEGTIQHDLYHLGQIGLVLKILRVKNQRQTSLTPSS